VMAPGASSVRGGGTPLALEKAGALPQAGVTRGSSRHVVEMRLPCATAAGRANGQVRSTSSLFLFSTGFFERPAGRPVPVVCRDLGTNATAQVVISNARR
jgi:hypothetical protein